MSSRARVCARGIMLAMLDAALQAQADAVTISRAEFERLQVELKFAHTKIEALTFEIARLNRWRFGQSSESLDAQVPLFDTIVADTAAEDQAAREAQHPRAAR